MRITSFTKASAIATIFAVLMTSGVALADRDGKGGGGGGGNNGGGGGGRSGDSGGRSGGGGDRSGGSSRSSGGGNSNSSSPSFKSSDSNKGSSGSQSTFRSGDSNKNMDSPKSSQFKQDQSGSSSNKGPRDFKALRPTDDQARDFAKQGSKDNKNADRFKDRSPKDRELADKEFNNWRKTWDGDKNNKGDKPNLGKNGHDNRDWSGNWKNSDRFNVADKIRSDWRGRKGNDFAFSDNWWKGNRRGNSWNFWGNYPGRNRYPYYWWNWTTGPRLGSWYAFNWATPYYWDYGPGEYIYADNGAIYVNGRWYQPAPVFYNQTAQLIDSQPVLTDESAAKLEWLPLGVFAATPDGLNEPDVIVQLATTKDGQIGGTAFDQKNGASFNIQGAVDKKTQRAVWSYTNDQNKRVMMETSAYNLTQPEATGMVHYSPTDMRTIELVRLQQPDAAASGNPTLPSPSGQ